MVYKKKAGVQVVGNKFVEAWALI